MLHSALSLAEDLPNAGCRWIFSPRVTMPVVRSQPGKVQAVILLYGKRTGGSNLEVLPSHRTPDDIRRTKILSACRDGWVVLLELRRATSFPLAHRPWQVCPASAVPRSRSPVLARP